MSGDLPYERILQECLKDEFAVLNAHLPRAQKSLLTLLSEVYPNVACNDGSTHYFKRKELAYLASLIDENEQETLLLPMLMEIRPDHDEVVITCGEAGRKIISNIIEMPVIYKDNKVTIYKSQLGVIRKALKTTTQYLTLCDL